uniref:DUF4238 domain-containing protein n=1 Tax=Rhodopseudomonas palustris (strain BisA53) TaxID=316055 RepID=Q07NQ8_RHOP5
MTVKQEIEKVVPRPRAIACDFCGHPYINPCTADVHAACPNMIAKREISFSSPQASIRHHYIPVFYTKRWCSDDRKLCQFSRPYIKIHSQRVFPVQTGFFDRLYEKKGVPKTIAQQIEDEFMSPVDNLAANALNLIETNFEKIQTDTKHRPAWSLFLMTLMMRMPEDIAILLQILADDWERDLPLLRQKYANNRKTDDPETLEAFIEEKDPDHLARWSMNLLPNLLDHEGIGTWLNGMRWSILTTPDDARPFLSSDRPLFMSKTFSEAECYLTLPISPHRLFLAVNSEKSECKFKDMPPSELALETNIQVVKHAVKYVYGVDDAELEFVDKHLSSNRPQTLLERLRDRRRDRYAKR